MKRFFILLFSAVITFFPLPSHAQSDLITYQGKLTNAAGADLPAGIYRVGFRIWDVATGGTVPLWARKYDVPVTGGLFSVMMGATGVAWPTPAPLTESLKLALSSGNRFVEITVMSDAGGPEKLASQWQELAPRQQLGSVPSAMNGVPAGTVVAFAGTVAPEGWVLCDGSPKLKTDPIFAMLWTVIGGAHGKDVPNANSFNVPDYRGQFLRGVDNGAGRDPDIGLRTQMNANGNTAGAVGSVQLGATRKPNNPFLLPARERSIPGSSSTVMRAASGEGTSNPVAFGDGGDQETRPLNAYVNYIIKL